MLKGKHIIVGITGGIAAFKIATLVRLLIKRGAEVQVVMTPNAKEFITPVTLSALTGKPVVSEFFSANTGEWRYGSRYDGSSFDCEKYRIAPVLR